MRKLLISLGIIILCIAIASCTLAGGFSSDADAIEKAAKSVLKIYVYESMFDEEPFATGSGFVAFDSSTLITNYHVIDGARVVIASDDDDNTYELDKVLCADENSDIAILRFSEKTKLKALELYPDDQLKRGSPVVAIGSPKGLKNTVSTGIVSYQFVTEGIPEIQITAPISPGSSGGALFNDDGKVIGVTSAIYKSKDEYGESTDAQNLNFAVNIAVAQAMYNAWDGKEYTFRDHKHTAKMDFSGVYKHDNIAATESTDKEVTSQKSSSTTETWICLNCGKENTTRYCQECGAEKPYWICVCGKINSSNKFCGECGQNHIQLIESLNVAIEKESENDYAGAITILEALGSYNSGSYKTNAGDHVEAKSRISKCYYEQGIYLQDNNGDHDDIVKAFTMAGDYSDAKEQIKGENTRYLKAFYDEGVKLLNDGEFDRAVEAFQNAGSYSDATEQIKAVYYAKGLSLLNEQDYTQCRKTLDKVGDYQDASTIILRSYYEEAEMAIENGEKDNAKKLFSKAGDYKDAKDRIKSIEEEEKDKVYLAAKEAFDNNDFEKAIKLYKQISGFGDADEMVVKASVAEIQYKYESIYTNPEAMSEKKCTDLESLLVKLDAYKSNSNAIELYKKICYAIAQFKQKSNLTVAIKYYQMAEDYLDSEEQLLNVKKQRIDQLVKQGNIATVIQYYADEFGQYELIKPESQGDHVEEILVYIKLLGIKTKGKIDTKIYKEEYIPYVQTIEEHFGFNNDGFITIDEYMELSDAICTGDDSSNVQALLEKLTDLSFIQKLTEKHSVYENKYTNSIKKAEKALGLREDGIITKDEYNAIISLNVEKPEKPRNLKMSVKNDTVTITWSKVKGAINYEVWRGSILLGTTTQSKWVDKEVETGNYYTYKVIAKKYTVESNANLVSQYVSPYYKPISISILNGSKNFYKGKYVKLSGLKIGNWTIDIGDGNFQNTLIAKSLAQNNDNCDVYLLCYSGNSYVEIVLEDYKSWGWDNKTQDLLGMINRISSITVEGQVNEEYSSWGVLDGVPSVIISRINWYY
ncbi:trypsin-like peptidase domain-containing protein [Clostridiales bacterium FE2011]|nr:trypsin-like peptidase domain-containing protein [Clostridiales bacterium FE2011]